MGLELKHFQDSKSVKFYIRAKSLVRLHLLADLLIF